MFLVFMGCAVSAAASGRYSARLIVDGAVSFAFIPIFEVVAFAFTWRRLPGTSRRPFAETLDEYLSSDTAWLIWLTAVSALLCVLPQRAIGAWIMPLVISTIVPLAWTIRTDRRFLQVEFAGTRRGATAGVVLTRAVAWPLIVGYFLGIAIWADIVPLIPRWLGL